MNGIAVWGLGVVKMNYDDVAKRFFGLGQTPNRPTP